MFGRFTDRARKVMALANREAQRFNHEYIGTEHILLGLAKEGTGVGANVLKNLGVDLRKVRREVEKLIKSGPEDMATADNTPQTPRAKAVLDHAVMEAHHLRHNYVGTEHLLLGLLGEHGGVAAQVLMNLGLKLEGVREEVLNLLGAGSAATYRPGAAPVPLNFSRALTRARAAAEGHAFDKQLLRLTTGHMLLGLLDQGESIAAKALASLGVDEAELRKRVAELLESEAEE